VVERVVRLVHAVQIVAPPWSNDVIDDAQAEVLFSGGGGVCGQRQLPGGALL
jgi:hypothetical protein